ncbi:hypothetical protein ACFOD4_20865 [Pseudoroseomonas globiformis]|uniref:Uncharacterized protein n=1 Tax=Teichococcus globiformis TaxID=2307229 RepID=A0ABV7G927_9PROT
MADREPSIRRASIIDLVDEQDALPAFRRRRPSRGETVPDVLTPARTGAGTKVEAKLPGEADTPASGWFRQQRRPRIMTIWAAGGTALVATVAALLSMNGLEKDGPGLPPSPPGRYPQVALITEMPGMLMPEPLGTASPEADTPEPVAAPLQQPAFAPGVQTYRLEVHRLAPVGPDRIVQAAEPPAQKAPAAASVARTEDASPARNAEARDGDGSQPAVRSQAQATARNGSPTLKAVARQVASAKGRGLANCRAVIVRVQLGERLTAVERRQLQDGCG